MATFFRKDGWVKSVIGPAVPGAQVYVCQQPANFSALPPSPLASIFSDINGLVPITQPIITDGFGHYDYYIAAGLYTEVIGLNNVIQQVYPDQDFGLGVPGPGNPYTAGANITIIGNVISAVIPPAAGVELQTNGVDNTLQTKLNLKSSDGSITITSDSLGGVDFSESVDVTTSFRVFGNLHGYSCNPDSILFDKSVGATQASSIGTWSNAAGNATVAPSIKMLTAAIPNGQAALYNNNNLGVSLGTLKWWQAKVSLGSTVTGGQIFYAGMSNVNPGTTAMQSTPTTQTVVAFRWISGLANWTCCACDGGGTATIVDSGVPVDTNFHLFQIFPLSSGASILFKIDGVTVATINTHVPANTVQMGSQTTLVGNSVFMSIQYNWWSY